MKIAVAVSTDHPASAVDMRFGRAPYFLVHDTETRNWQSVVNENAGHTTHGNGSGARAASKLCAMGVRAVIGGEICGKAFAVLHRAGVRAYGAGGLTAEQAVVALERGCLEQLATHTHDAKEN